MISVITPCLNIIRDNRREYFERMMRSIHTQSLPPQEHIFIDGGSTDGTQELIKQYEQRGLVTHFISEKDTGIYSALNKGLRLAHEKYIHIMHTDDYVTDSDFFKISVEKLEKHNVEFTHADKIVESKTDGTLSLNCGNEKVAFFRMPFRHQTMLVRKTVFDEIGFFNEDNQIASDYEFILKMLLAHKKGYHFPKVFIHSRGGGLSSNREICTIEVPRVIYTTWGKKYGFTLRECQDIYLNEHMFTLLSKIFTIKNPEIRNSLLYSYYPGARKRDMSIELPRHFPSDFYH